MKKQIVKNFSLFALIFLFTVMIFSGNKVSADSEISISKYEDLKKNSVVREVLNRNLSENKIKILCLNKGNYKLSEDISLSEQQFRKDYPGVVFDYGLISLIDSNFDGNGKTITLEDEKSHPLFLDIKTTFYDNINNKNDDEKKQVSNLNLKTKNVYLAPFAFNIETYSDTFLNYRPLNISNISVEVDGNVIPQKSSSAFYIIFGTPTVSASGFAQDIYGANLDNIKLKINGDIGSYTSEDPMPTDKDKYWFMSCGFARGVNRQSRQERISLKTIDLNNLSESAKEIKKSGSLENVKVNIKGNIVSHGNVATFASAFAKASSMYVDKLDIDIDGNIENIQDGGNSINSLVSSFVTLAADDVVVMANSNITINGDIKIEERGKINNPNQHQTKIYLGSEGNSIGYYNLLYNNKLNVKGNINAKNNNSESAFFGGSFTQLWGNIALENDTIIQKNITEVDGDINYNNSGFLQFEGIFDRLRQPVDSNSTINVNHDKTFSSVKDNSAKYGNINLHGGNYLAGALIAYGMNTSNGIGRIADINSVEYYKDISVKTGDINLSVDSGTIDFTCGVNNLFTSMKDVNIDVGNITATGNNLDYFSISGATGYMRVIDLKGDNQKSKLYKDYKPTIENVNIKIGNINAKLGYVDGAKAYLAGIVGYSDNNTIVKNSNVSIGNINVENTNLENLKNNSFYLGGAIANGKSEVNNVLASTKSIDVNNLLYGYVGGFTGYDYNQTVDNCKSFIDGNLNVENAKITTNVGGFNGYKYMGSTKNSDSLVTANIEVKDSNYPNIGGFIGYNYQSEDLNNASQILGSMKSTSYVSNSNIGGYIGKVYNVNANNCSSLIFEDIENSKKIPGNSSKEISTVSPFIGFVAYTQQNQSNKVSNSATYVGGKVIGENSYKGALSGGLTFGDISNFTYLVDKEVEGTDKDKLFTDKYIGFFDNINVKLGNIYTVIVNKGDREAYQVSYDTKENKFTKNKNSIGKISIAPRSFQEEFWGQNLNRTKTIGTFEYVKDSAGLNFENYNNTVENVGDNNKNVNITNFINRNLSIQNNGVTYDLLGIKSGKVEEDKKPSEPGNGGSNTGGGNSGSSTDKGKGDRVDTSISISNKHYGKSKIAIICRKDLYPDSLTATVLAKILNAPILLTDSEILDLRVGKELRRLGVDKVIIVGGYKSVSDNVKIELEKVFGYDVERISGVDRYGTSEMVARRVIKLSKNKNKAVVASGEVFADALSISPFAAKNEYPILLVTKENVPTQIRRVIKDLKIENSYVVGGENTISVNNYKKLPKPIERIGGFNRYETSVLVAKYKFRDSNKAYITSGEVFADALVIGPIAGKESVPILLVRKNPPLPEVKNYILNSKIEDIEFIGGYNTISKDARSYFKK